MPTSYVDREIYLHILHRTLLRISILSVMSKACSRRHRNTIVLRVFDFSDWGLHFLMINTTIIFTAGGKLTYYIRMLVAAYFLLPVRTYCTTTTYRVTWPNILYQENPSIDEFLCDSETDFRGSEMVECLVGSKRVNFFFWPQWYEPTYS